MKEPTVSVIVTTYNREEFLKETILSILNQTYTDFELIVVDNYSNYDFYKVIESFGDSRIRPYQNPNNGIIAVNRNFGISKARGKLLAFCDDDDLWLPEKLEKQVNKIEKEELDIITSNAYVFTDQKTQNNKTNNKAVDNLRILVQRNELILSSVLLRRSDIVLFDESPIFHAVEDYKLWLNLLMAGYRFGITKEALIYYRISQYGEYSQNILSRYLKITMIMLNMRFLFPDIFGMSLFLKSVFANILKYVVKSSLHAVRSK